MSNTRRLWRITGLIGLLATLVLVAGFIYGVKTVLYPHGEELQSASPEGQTGAPQKDKVQILALGDSLTKGYGDDSGEGYVGKVKKLLVEKSDKPVFLWNFAVNGATTADMLADINKPSARDYISQANIILFTIGGNDMNRAATRITGTDTGASPAPSGAAAPTPSAEAGGPEDMPAEIQFDYDALAKQLPEAAARLSEIIDKISEINPAAQIVYVALYHPFMEFDENRLGAEWIGKWNDAAFQAANQHANVTVVPTYDLFQNHWQEYLFTDHFHPNSEAYGEIAARVAQVLKVGG